MLNVAHRGGPIHRPENTFAAFDYAPELGTTWVESDVKSSKDGELVLIHDSTVDRTTDGSGEVHDLTLGELKALDAGSWFSPEYAGERIPTLLEFFDRYKGKLRSMMEIKSPGRVEEQLVQLIEAQDAYEETIVIGSDRASLVKVKELDPRVEIGWTAFEPTEENISLALEMKCHHIGCRHQFLTSEIVAAANTRGLQVRSTNVPDEEAMKHVVSCGVVGMTINFPDKLAEHLREIGIPQN
jgi:glycerophosphoryl diester phosphodiesterase